MAWLDQQVPQGYWPEGYMPSGWGPEAVGNELLATVKTSGRQLATASTESEYQKTLEINE